MGGDECSHLIFDMRKILTIAIPTYNMERYIGRCLDSLLIYEGFENLQILVINDGSKDRSSEIAHQYAQEHPDSILVIDKENGNYGSCVNVAVQKANGKYLKILDADDYFNRSEFETLIKRLNESESDAVLTNHTIITSKGANLWRHSYTDGQTIALSEECPNYFPMHSITYRTDLLKEMCYTQTEGISYTDQEWILYPMLNAEKMIYMDLNIYQYCMDREGQTMDPKIFAKGLPMLYKVFLRALDYRTRLPYDIPSSKTEYYDIQLFKQAETIYKQELVFNSSVSNQLSILELKIKESAPALYNRLGCLSIGFHRYVKRYRTTGQGLPFFNRRTLYIECRIKNLTLALLNRIKHLNR